jgi:hypothetical protein
MELSELIYALMVSKKYIDLSKATEEDLCELAKSANRAANIYGDVSRTGERK